jgi:hypothetical protein
VPEEPQPSLVEECCRAFRSSCLFKQTFTPP